VDVNHQCFAFDLGMGLGNPYCDPLLSSAVHKIGSRQRWTPKPAQLQILEQIFEQCNATPGRQKIKDITRELAQHGQISETNVYNWFQNRRARSKRKQSAVVPNNGESEMETDIESLKEKKTRAEDSQPDENTTPMADHMYFNSPDIGTPIRLPLFSRKIHALRVPFENRPLFLRTHIWSEIQNTSISEQMNALNVTGSCVQDLTS
jgi:hypothetical protein